MLPTNYQPGIQPRGMMGGQHPQYQQQGVMGSNQPLMGSNQPMSGNQGAGPPSKAGNSPGMLGGRQNQFQYGGY